MCKNESDGVSGCNKENGNCLTQKGCETGTLNFSFSKDYTSKDTRVKTVKPHSAFSTPILTSVETATHAPPPTTVFAKD